MRIWVKPDLLARLGLTVPDVAGAIQQQSTVNPSGQVGAEPGAGRAGDDLHGPLAGPAADRRGVRRHRRPLESGRLGHPAARCRAHRARRAELPADRPRQRPAGLRDCGLPGARLERARRRRGRAQTDDRAAEPLPGGPAVSTYTLDTTRAVSEGIREIVITLAEAMVLVMLVVYLFLQNWRATLIPVIAVPVSLIGTFVVFPPLGFSVNTLSLFGLVLAIGLVVDDAIVVVEAVEHHIEEGMAPRDATLKAMEEVSGPVVSIALILAAVFIPVALHGRHPGQPQQAVRDHHRHLGADLRLQRADAVAGAGGDVAAAAQGGRGCWAASSGCSTAGSRRRRRATSRSAAG